MKGVEIGCMSETDKSKTNGNDANQNKLPPGIDSRFRLIIVAGLRSKQLVRGSRPRVEVDPKRRRHTSIALEEVKRGLVPFRAFDGDKTNGLTLDSGVQESWINARVGA